MLRAKTDLPPEVEAVVSAAIGCGILVELKAVPRLREFHRQQVISYLRTTGLRIGLLPNFNAVLLKEGMKRVVL